MISCTNMFNYVLKIHFNRTQYKWEQLNASFDGSLTVGEENTNECGITGISLPYAIGFSEEHFYHNQEAMSGLYFVKNSVLIILIIYNIYR